MEQIELLKPKQGETVNICAEYDEAFARCVSYRDEKKLIKKILKEKGETECTRPEPACFEWSGGESPYVLEISENESFENALNIICTESKAQIYNLKKNTRYFWRVNGGRENSFTTDKVFPRRIYAEGCYNIRDTGGETNTEGKVIKQGLAYRGVRFDGFITENGIETMRSLGIKTEIDLRREAVGKFEASLLGDNVKYILHPCNGYEDFTDPQTKALLSYFACESNYPIYYHCAGGADRTGTLAFMLGAILGQSDEQLIKNYELTMLASPEKRMSRCRKGKIKKFLKLLKKKGGRGTPLRVSAVNLLLENGVEEETLEAIRKIWL